MMIDRVRTSLHRAITSPLGDGFVGVRLPKDLARRANVALGSPLCSKSELERRRKGAAKLEELKRSKAPGSKIERDRATVMIYFEKDRNARMLQRMKDALEAKGFAYTLLDVSGDETTKDFVMREAHVEEDDLPIAFVGGKAIGGYNELVDWDVSGRLAKAVTGS